MKMPNPRLNIWANSLTHRMTTFQSWDMDTPLWEQKATLTRKRRYLQICFFVVQAIEKPSLHQKAESAKLILLSIRQLAATAPQWALGMVVSKLRCESATWTKHEPLRPHRQNFAQQCNDCRNLDPRFEETSACFISYAKNWTGGGCKIVEKFTSVPPVPTCNIPAGPPIW